MSRVGTPQTYGMTTTNSEDEIEVASIGDEMVYTLPGEPEGSGGAGYSAFPLATFVDVSQQLSFPPIGNQGSYNSCVAWSLAYYQLTNNTNIVRGLNAKSTVSSTMPITANVMSPRWTYTQINVGKDIPTYYDEACAAIASYGGVPLSDYSGVLNSTNIQQWSTDTALWNKGIRNKPQQITWGDIDTSGVVTGTLATVEQLKRILSNGYVVTIPTFVDSYVYTKRTTTGVSGLRHRSNTSIGGHAMTVVGYDDNFWVDVNNNNAVNSGETGAFKIANSWGTSNTNYTNGYLWIPYDALGQQSGVSGATTSRQPAFSSYYFIQAQKSYEPLLVAEVTISAARRNQIGVQFGVSSTSLTSPQSTLDAVYYHHIAFTKAKDGFPVIYGGQTALDRNYTGGTTEATATIAFDLTPLIKVQYRSGGGLPAKSDVKLYVNVTDTTSDSYPVKLSTVKIVEPMTGQEVTATDTATLSANGSTVSKSVNFQITPCLKTDPMQDVSVTFTNPLSSSSVTSSTVSVKDGCGTVVNGVTYGVSNRNVMIYAPTNGYDIEVKYEIQFGSGISSVGGNKLGTTKSVLFYVLGDYYYWY